MMRDKDEQQIRRLFDGLKPGDESATPPFEQVLNARARRRHTAARAWPRRASLGTAAVALAAVSSWLVTRTSAPEPSVTPAEAAPFYWQSPTGTLLNAPGDPPSPAHAGANWSEER